MHDMDSEVALSQSFLNEYRQRIPARSGILVPLRVGDAVVGMLTGTYPDRRAWTQDDLQILLVAAAQAAVRVRSLYLLQVSERRAHQLETASVIARDIGRTLSLETVLNRAVNLIRERFGFYHATVFLLDERGEYAEARAATGEAWRVMLRSGHKLRVGSKSVVGQTAARGEPVVVNDVRSNPVHRPNPLLPDTLAEAGFPLRVGECDGSPVAVGPFVRGAGRRAGPPGLVARFSGHLGCRNRSSRSAFRRSFGGQGNLRCSENITGRVPPGSAAPCRSKSVADFRGVRPG
jgi:GAF domain-containing protein